MEKLYFIGGAKGVGKSSLCEILSKKIKLEIINTGKFFSKLESSLQTKKRIIGYMIKYAPLIIDTHYAGFVDGVYSGEFERGLYIEELEYLNENIDLKLILIELDKEILISRRLNDNQKNRDKNIRNIEEELRYNRLFFIEYCDQLKKEGVIIKNCNLSESLNKILNFINKKR